jgi:hypothetical protein
VKAEECSLEKLKRKTEKLGCWIRRNIPPLLGIGFVCLIYAMGFGYIFSTTLTEHPRMERLGWWSQTIATLTAILTAFYVAVQVADIKRSSRTEAFESGATRMQDIARVLLAYPEQHQELRQGGQLSVDAEILAESLLDTIDTELLRQKVLPDPWQKELPSFESWYTDLFLELPGLRQTLDKRRTWYGDEIYALKDKATRMDTHRGDHPSPPPPVTPPA